MPDDSSIQRVSRLTPLSAILALIESRVAAVQACRCRLARATNHILAEDATASVCPPSAIALRDGFAVEAAAVVDAGPYAPVALSPTVCRIDAGQRLPNGTDAVLPLDAVLLRDNRVEAIAAVAAGEGALPAGGDAAMHAPLRRSGQRLRGVDIAVLSAASITEVSIRVPRLRIVGGSVATTPLLQAALDYLSYAVMLAGADGLDSVGSPMSLDQALTQSDSNGVIAVGGTGSGRNDRAVQTLARLGQVEAHGIAISPGETAAFGFAGAQPVLLIPGRLDAALTAWLLIGRPLVAKLAGAPVEEIPALLPLKRKVTSTIGLTELVPVSCAGGMAEPLGSGYLSLNALARSDGWIVVPAESEGFPAGTQVAVRTWP